jgi:hypothetical protein
MSKTVSIRIDSEMKRAPSALSKRSKRSNPSGGGGHHGEIEALRRR